MISLTRLSGSQFVLNSDLIERVDATPDTVVTLVDGKKYVVAEGPEAIIRAVRTHRSQIIALSHVLPDELLGAQGEEFGHDHLAPVAPLRRHQDREV